MWKEYSSEIKSEEHFIKEIRNSMTTWYVAYDPKGYAD